jgi:peptidoglycan-associated lipoprotein
MRALFIVLTVVAIGATGCPGTKKLQVADVGCTKDSQCSGVGVPGFCDHGQCVACRVDSDCGVGVCASGRCEVEVASVCQCAEGEECVDGVCVVVEEEVVETEVVDPFCFGDLCDGESETEVVQISNECLPMVGSENVVALSSIEFDFDDFDLDDVAQETLVFNAECLEQAPDLVIVLEGHADERGTPEYNLALGNERAAAVRRYLAHLGVDESRLKILSKGEEEPICADKSEDCWHQNRRVDLIQVRESTLTAN